MNPNDVGTLVEDVAIGGFRRPWNAKPEARRLAKGIPRAPLWAYSPGGENQVGCIYTAQGFEFDYVGVIFGTDLVYRAGEGWVGDKRNSHDSIVKRAGDRFVELVKNTYRVLLTRGIKGCYVCFLDRATEDFFEAERKPCPPTILIWLRNPNVTRPRTDVFCSHKVFQRRSEYSSLA